MPRDSSGNYSLPAGNPVVTGTTIASSWGNSTLNDVASVLTASLDRNGNGHMLAPIQTPSGTVGAPSHSFTTDTATGLYLISPSRLGLAIGGVLNLDVQNGIWSVKASNVTFTAPPSATTITIQAATGAVGLSSVGAIINAPSSGVTLAVNGIGSLANAADFQVIVTSNLTAYSQFANLSTGTAGVQLIAIGNNSHGFDIGITSINYSGAYLTSGPTGESNFVSGGGNAPLSFATNGIERVRIAAAGAVTINGVLGVNGNAGPAQVTGFGTPTGTGVIANFPGASATLPQCSQAIAQLIKDIKAIGFYGA